MHAATFFFGIRHGHPYYGYPKSDSYGYLAQAKNIRDAGSWYCGDLDSGFDPNLVSQRPPLYGLVIYLTGGILPPHMGLLIIQNLLGIANILFMFWLGTRFLGIRKDHPGWFALLWFPSQFIFANVVMSEILFQSFVLTSVAFLMAFLKCGRRRDLYVSQFALALAMLTKPVMYLMWMPMALFLLVYMIRKRTGIRYIPAILIPFLTVLGISLHNRQATGYLHYASIRNFNLLYYNTNYTLQEAVGAEKADIMITDLTHRIAHATTYAEGQRLLEAQCLHWLWQYKGVYARMEGKGLLKFFLDPGRWDLYNFLGLPQNDQPGWMSRYQTGGAKAVLAYVASFPTWVWLFMFLTYGINIWMLIGLMHFVRGRYPERHMRIAVTGTILYFAVLAGPLASGRFRLPVYPLIAMAALSGWAHRKTTTAAHDRPMVSLE
ncbi:MAG: glycosyltransferase family 39 protein [Flavobacteriales bacterium]|nr:glycosyltransferase family 39 protein [Flavobacteriales bacterium]